MEKKRQISLPSQSEESLQDSDSDQIEQQFQKIAANLTKDTFLIFPDSLFILVWTYLSYMVAYYETIVVPYRLSFHQIQKNRSLIQIELVLEVFWILDMLLSLTTGFYNKGLLIMNRHKIIKNYFKNNFLGDIVAIVPVFWVQKAFGI